MRSIQVTAALRINVVKYQRISRPTPETDTEPGKSRFAADIVVIQINQCSLDALAVDLHMLGQTRACDMKIIDVQPVLLTDFVMQHLGRLEHFHSNSGGTGKTRANQLHDKINVRDGMRCTPVSAHRINFGHTRSQVVDIGPHQSGLCCADQVFT